MATGRVIHCSPNGAMVVVQHDEGFTLIELLGAEGELEPNDIVKADFTATAGEELQETDEGRVFDVYMQGCWPSSETPIRLAS